MKEIFKQISTEITEPNPEYFKKKRQIILTDIRGEWYIRKVCNNKTLTKNTQLINKEQEK